MGNSQKHLTSTDNYKRDSKILPEYRDSRKIYRAANKMHSYHQHSRQYNAQIHKSLEYKVQGNHFIQQKQYKRAIECYTQNLYDHDSIYYSNRAVANRLLNRLQEAKQDAQQAIHLDRQNARAHFIHGTIILQEVQMFPDISDSLIKYAEQGIYELEEAQNSVKMHTDKLKIMINQNLAKGKRMKFLILNEMDKKNILILKQTLLDVFQRQSQPQIEIQFKIIDDIELPECFTCPITYEIMEDPTLLNSGLSYEKTSIQQQFKYKNIDPITRDEINYMGLIQNLQLKDAIQDIKKKYGWLGIENEQDYKAIKFE